MSIADEARYAREQEFHDERFTEETRQRTDRYYAVDAGGARYASLLEALAPDARVLEYGCGAGSSAFRLAEVGADVLGIDISPVGVAAAAAEAATRGSSARFEVHNAEALDLPESSFDVVCGSGILHHLDLDRAMAEVHRVLRPGGTAVFLEPLGTNPLINAYRRWTPSLRTPDEHPLLEADLAAIATRFERTAVERFDLLALVAAPLAGRSAGRRLAVALHRADARLFARWPRVGRWAWVAVLRLEKGHEPA